MTCSTSGPRNQGLGEIAPARPCVSHPRFLEPRRLPGGNQVGKALRIGELGFCLSGGPGEGRESSLVSSLGVAEYRPGVRGGGALLRASSSLQC